MIRAIILLAHYPLCIEWRLPCQKLRLPLSPAPILGRATHAAGNIPAVIYGNGKEPKHVILPGHETTLAVRNKDAVLVIEVDGEQFKARVQDIQRHPIRPELQHIDLLFVD